MELFNRPRAPALLLAEELTLEEADPAAGLLLLAVTFGKGGGVASRVASRVVSLGTAVDEEAEPDGRDAPDAPEPGPDLAAAAERTKSRSTFLDSG